MGRAPAGRAGAGALDLGHEFWALAAVLLSWPFPNLPGIGLLGFQMQPDGPHDDLV